MTRCILVTDIEQAINQILPTENQIPIVNCSTAHRYLSSGKIAVSQKAKMRCEIHGSLGKLLAVYTAKSASIPN